MDGSIKNITERDKIPQGLWLFSKPQRQQDSSKNRLLSFQRI